MIHPILAITNYVPWDTSVLVSFADYIRKTVGVTVNVALVGFAIILAVLVAIKIVNKFIKV